MSTKSALQILEQLRQMPNVPEQTRQSLVMLCDVLNNADAHTPNEVHLANAGLFALEQVLAGELEQLGELYFNEGASWLDAATPRGYHSQRHGIAMTLRQVITGLSMKDAIEMASELMSKHKYPIYSPRVESELLVADETLSKVHVCYVSSEPMDIDVSLLKHQLLDVIQDNIFRCGRKLPKEELVAWFKYVRGGDYTQEELNALVNFVKE